MDTQRYSIKTEPSARPDNRKEQALWQIREAVFQADTIILDFIPDLFGAAAEGTRQTVN